MSSKANSKKNLGKCNYFQHNIYLIYRKDKLTKTPLQIKLKEATSNEHCHANVSLLNEISQRTEYYSELQIIVSHVSKKLNCRREKWRKILKCLFLVEHILKTGSMNFYDQMKSLSYQFRNLNTFSYIDVSRVEKGETSKIYY